MLNARKILVRRGFTLIEILVIAALISLLAGMAIFSVQYLVQSSKRKAAIADARTVANSLSMAAFDVGFYPQVGFLSFSSEELQRMVGRVLPAGADETVFLPPHFDALGFDTMLARGRQVYPKWTGAYVPKPDARSTLSPSVGYVTRVRLPDAAYRNGDPVILNWPADPFGNPYVAYLSKMKKNPDTGEYDATWIETAADKTNYKALVVSYGINRIPGGDDKEGLSPGEVNDILEEFGLYRALPDDEAAEYEVLRAADYTPERLTPLDDTYDTRPADMGPRPGILGNGSDDVACPIP